MSPLDTELTATRVGTEKTFATSVSHGTLRLWELSEEVRIGDLHLVHVLTSAAMVLGKAETCVLAATPEGKIFKPDALPGSFKGELNHERAIMGFLKEYKDSHGFTDGCS